MTKSPVDANELAKQIATRNERAVAAEQAARDKAAADNAAPVAPSARSRWRFGIERHETAEGDTLVIRCYPRKLAHYEEDGPFSKALQVGGIMLVLVPMMLFTVDWRAGLVATAAFLIGLIYVHYARIVRIHITHLNQFVIYERNPKRPIGLGPVAHLGMDVTESMSSMRCQWKRERSSNGHFGLDNLRRADWLTVQQFIAKHRLRFYV